MTHRRYHLARVGHGLVAALLAVVLGACASSKPPSEVVNRQVTEAETLVAQAEEADAKELAPLALRHAQQKLEEARSALADGETARAQRLAEQARVDAELAEVTARAEKMQRAAQEVRASIEALEEEIRRASGRDG